MNIEAKLRNAAQMNEKNFQMTRYISIFAAMRSKSGYIYVLFLVVVSMMVSSCSKYQQLLKSNRNEDKYTAAVQFYEKKDYDRALPLFEQLLTISKGTSKYEMVFYYYANCYYGQGDYEEGSFYFENFVTNFPNSKYAEECSFMGAFCYYLNSPNSSLDQSNTKKAMLQLQLFTNKYPKSTKVDQCNQLIDLLREKLMKKDYETAKLYYNMNDYRGATVCFKNLVKNFPDTKYKEESLYLCVKSYYNWANNSIETKKEERFKATMEAYNIFIDNFPKSKYVKESEGYFEGALKQLDKKRIAEKITLGN